MTNPPGSLVLQLDPRQGVFRNSEGAFITLRNNRILFAYSRFTNGDTDEAGADIAARHSDDQGRTWSAADEVIIPAPPHGNVMSVSFLRLHSGRIALLYLVKDGGRDCRPRIRFSDDEARTWSEPVTPIPEVGWYVVNNDRLVQLRSGRLVIPAAIHPEAVNGAEGRKLGLGTFFLSDDDGQTWRRSASTLRLDSSASWTGIQEPGVIELADGRLFGWCRNDLGCQYGMESRDQGQTWSPPQPTEFVSPCSPMSMKRIVPVTGSVNPPAAAHGDLLAVWNDHAGRFPVNPERGRQPLVSALSRDEGKTWFNHKQIESDLSRGYHYTAIHCVDDQVLLAYCAGPKYPGRQLSFLRVRKVPVQWFYAT